jgi:hypothetical protein
LIVSCLHKGVGPALGQGGSQMNNK